MSNNSDPFVIRKGVFFNDKYALKDYSIFNREQQIPKEFYQFYFFRKLLMKYSIVECFEFLIFQIENSHYGYGFVSFLKEEFITLKQKVDILSYRFRKNEREIEEIKNNTNLKKLSQLYREEISIDPYLEFSRLYFEDSLHENDIRYRVDEILTFLMDYQENFKIHKKEKNIDVEDFDVEELVQINQKILLMHKLGIIDFLIEKYSLDKEMNINHLSNVIHCFTGMGTTTIQSIINPIYNDFNSQKNNPYNIEKNIAKVQAKMIELKLIKE